MQVCHVPDGCESLNVLTPYTGAVHTLHYQDDRCAYGAAQMAKVLMSFICFLFTELYSLDYTHFERSCQPPVQSI